MGIFKWLFGKKKIEEEPENLDETSKEVYEQPVYERDHVNFHDEAERSRYLLGCVEQIGEAKKEEELLKGEYNLVTAYLTDMEEIEALPKEEAEELQAAARRIVTLEEDLHVFAEKKTGMADSDYRKIQRQEGEIEEGIAKIREAEKYHKLVQQDLRRLDGEKKAYKYRKNELETMLMNLKGVAVIWLLAVLACMVMLSVLRFGFDMDTAVGFLIAIGVGAVAVTFLCVKYLDAQSELTRVEKASNKLILLQNKVKIRYVNNVQLLDYLYMKYGVENGQTLAKLWKMYQHEKENRRQFAELEGKLDYNQRQLLQILRRYQVKDPERWIYQAKAIIDRKEMIEIRHGLIVRRQSLRSQLQYNRKVAEEAGNELEQISALYPQYRTEIVNLKNRYQRDWNEDE